MVPEWQGKASAVLVVLAVRFPRKICEDLLALFGPGVVPHYFVMKTLGDMAIAHPVGTVPLLGDVLSRMLPVLSAVKADNMRWVFATAIGHMCEAMNAYKLDATGTVLDVTVFSAQVYAAYELMAASWLPAKETKVRLATVQAMGAITTILATPQLQKEVPVLVPILNGMYKKEAHEHHVAITQAYRDLLLVSTKEELHALWAETGPKEKPSLLDVVLNTLFPLACRPVDFTQQGSLKNNNELLRSIEICAKAFIDRILTFLFQKVFHFSAGPAIFLSLLSPWSSSRHVMRRLARAPLQSSSTLSRASVQLLTRDLYTLLTL